MKIQNIKEKYNPRPGRGGVGEWRSAETDEAEDALQDIIDKIAADKIQSNPSINKKLRMHKTFGAYLTGDPGSEEEAVQKIFRSAKRKNKFRVGHAVAVNEDIHLELCPNE